MPSFLLLHVRAVTREGRAVKGAQISLWRIIPAGALKPLPGNWSTSETGELRTRLPLPSELLTVASENRTPLRFLVVAWHPQAGWAWAIRRLDELQNLGMVLQSAGRAVWNVQNCFSEPTEGLKGRIVRLQIPGVRSPVDIPPLPGTVLQTDASGNASVLLPEGSTAYWEWEEPLPFGMREQFREPIALTVGHHRVRYHTRTREITGVLVDNHTRRPLRDESVMWYEWLKIVLSVLPPEQMSFTDSHGRFTIRSSPARGGPLSVTTLRFPDGTRVGVSLLEPKATWPKETDCERWDLGVIPVPPADAEVVGQAVTEQSAPAPFAWIIAQRSPSPPISDELDCRVTTCEHGTRRVKLRVSAGYAQTFIVADQRGRFRLELRPGEWAIKALDRQHPAVRFAPDLPGRLADFAAVLLYPDAPKAKVESGKTLQLRLVAQKEEEPARVR